MFCLGEANFSDHGANRLGASALMQGLSDGYFVIPYTIGDYLAKSGAGAISPDSPEVKEVMESVRERVGSIVSSQMAKDRPAPITRNLDKSCGNTLEWPEMKRD